MLSENFMLVFEENMVLNLLNHILLHQFSLCREQAVRHKKMKKVKCENTPQKIMELSVQSGH
jgi:hypothetical protein